MATLLSICQEVADNIGLARPTQVASSVDQTTRTLLGCAQREGFALARRWAWQALLREQTFLSVAAMVQTNSIPTDWDGRMVADTFWNRTARRHVRGPVTSQEWQAMQAAGSGVAGDTFRFRNNSVEIYPNPVAGDTYAFEYISKNWCKSTGGNGQSAWALDTDEPVLDAELMMLGVTWRFLQGRGMDASVAVAAYEGAVSTAVARDGSRPIVNFARGRALGPMGIVAEGSWPL